MSPISLSLELLLAVLLVAALGFGWRLERRLKGLRESHGQFAQAVADLDRAAHRAEVGLAELREATDEAIDLLAGRIEKARELAAKLEKLTQDGAAITQRPANDAARLALDGHWTKTPRADHTWVGSAPARRLPADDSLELRTPAPPDPAVRSRVGSTDDDELFEFPTRSVSAGAPRGRS
jgi:hypothetical protein